MTVIEKRLISLIALMLALLTVASCGTTPPVPVPESSSDEQLIITTQTPETAPEPPEGLLIAGPDVAASCAVIYPAGASTIADAAVDFVNYIVDAVPGTAIKSFSETQSVTDEYRITLKNDPTLASSYSVTLTGKTVSVIGKNTENTLEALSYLKMVSVKDGYFYFPEDLSLSSGDGPAVLSQSPEKYYYYEDVYTPTLVYTFDASAVVADSARLVVNGTDYTSQATWESGKVTLDSFTVDAGDHTVLLSLTDANGNIEVFETTFTCGDGSIMNLYAGELHAHTTDSDGSGTIKDAYAYARDVAKLDFFSVTDHSNSFKNEIYQKNHITNADSFNDPGKFVALYGYEQTYSAATYYGHLNTINYGSLTTRSTLLEDYYSVMTTDPNSIVMFNHPGYKWGNFGEYDFWSEEYDKVVNLTEIKGKSYDSEYALSLTKGWHVSPLYNEDNHSPNWGNAYEYCGYALAPSLTRQNIIEAFQKNRTYTTTDMTLKIYYKINDEWMGSRLNSPDKLKVSISLSTQKSQGLGTVYLIGEDNIVVASKKLGTVKKYDWEFEIDPSYDYYYVKVDSGNTWCVTAPIWIENREQLTISELSQSLLENAPASKDYRISASIKNSSDVTLTNATVSFYLSGTSGFDSTTKKPAATVTVGNISAGQTVTVSADLAYSPDSNRIYVIASAESEGKKYGAVEYTEISNIYFSEIVPKTAQGGAPNYEFIEIYNNSNLSINLASYSLRYYPKPGAKADALKENTWALSGKIEPHSTLVLWFVPENCNLTIADFNKRYNTSLVGGKDIVMIVGKSLPDANPVQLEILKGTKVVARCWYNWEGAVDVFPDRAVTFRYPTDYTFTAKIHKARIYPTPGELADGQMPAVISG